MKPKRFLVCVFHVTAVTGGRVFNPMWLDWCFAVDDLIVVKETELLLGVIDKNAIGTSEYGLTHSVYELYGAQRAAAFLTAIGRLLTIYLQVCFGVSHPLSLFYFTPKTLHCCALSKPL